MRLDEQRCPRAVCHYTILVKLELAGGDRYGMSDAKRQAPAIHVAPSATNVTQ